MNLPKIGVVLLAFLIAGMAMVPMVSAAEKIGQVTATQDQLVLINQLWGTNITVGEYMEKVYPEHLANIPNDVKQDMYARQIVWSDGKNTDPITSKSLIPNAIGDLVVAGAMDFYSGRIQYRSVAFLNGGMDASYVYVTSNLKKGGTIVASTYNYAYNANGVEAIGNLYNPTSGYYSVYSYGYSIGPDRSGSQTTAQQYYS